MAPSKSPAKSAELPSPEYVPQAHGGAILAGGKPGNAGGTGRPRNDAREKLANIVNGIGVEYVRKVLAGEEEGATIQHRLDAFEKAAKFGVGALKSVDEDDVRDRLRRTLEVITSRLPADAAEALLGEIEPIWR